MFQVKGHPVSRFKGLVVYGASHHVARLEHLCSDWLKLAYRTRTCQFLLVARDHLTIFTENPLLLQ